MSGFSFKTEGPQFEGEGVRKPVTKPESKRVMLTAERRDEIAVETVINTFQNGVEIPEKVSVRQRTNTYYGPKLLTIDGSGIEYLLTAPGPDSQLILWRENINGTGNRGSWARLAEIQATLTNNSSPYHLCHQCNQPLKSADHERLVAIGQCPNV